MWPHMLSSGYVLGPLMTDTLERLGLAYFDLRDYSRALACFLEQLEIASRLGDLPGVARAAAHMGAVYERQADYSRARVCYRHAASLQRDFAEETTQSPPRIAAVVTSKRQPTNA